MASGKEEPSRPNLFEAIGYSGEVSEPNGPAVKGYFLDRWGQEANDKFVKYVTAREEALREHIESELRDLPTTRAQSLTRSWETVGLEVAIETVRECFEDFK